MPESIVLQYFLEVLTDKCRLEERVLAGQTLERDRLATRTRGQYRTLKESQMISGKAQVLRTVNRRSPGTTKMISFHC